MGMDGRPTTIMRTDMRTTFFTFLRDAREAILNDTLLCFVLHTCVAFFLYLVFFNFSHPTSGRDVLVLAVDSFLLGAGSAELVYFPRRWLHERLGLRVGLVAEVVYGILVATAGMLLVGLGYPTVHAIAPTALQALKTALLVASLGGVLSLLSGAVSLRQFRLRSLLPSRV